MTTMRRGILQAGSSRYSTCFRAIQLSAHDREVDTSAASACTSSTLKPCIYLEPSRARQREAKSFLKISELLCAEYLP